MLKCHLSVINHKSVSQLQDIDLSNYNSDRVAGADFHSISGTERHPDLSLYSDLDDTYYSVYLQSQRQVTRLVTRALDKAEAQSRLARSLSCPDLALGIEKESEDLSNSNWQYITAREGLFTVPKHL